MPVLQDGDILRLSLQAEFDGTEDVMNVYDFRVAGGYNLTEALFADELKELVVNIITIVKTVSNVLTIYKRFRATVITQVDAGRLIELDAEIPGTALGDPTPAGCCALLVFRVPKPKTVLKKYMGVMSEDGVGGAGDIVSGTMAAGAAIIASLLDPIATGRTEYSYGYYDEPLTTFHYPTGGYINSEPAYQRRRRRGAGS